MHLLPSSLVTWRRGYHPVMATFGEQLREHVAAFFTNWSNPDYGFAEKVGLTVRNRVKSLGNRGCCGNHGQPGC
jgi:hypothetical protein